MTSWYDNVFMGIFIIKQFPRFSVRHSFGSAFSYDYA